MRSLSKKVLVILSIASVARAQSGSENLAFFGTLGQGNNAVINGNGNQGQAVADNSCMPTAVANGLSFLQAYELSVSHPDPLTFVPSYASVNNLITRMGTTSGGTGIASTANGLVSYLSPAGENPGPTISVSGQYGSVTPAGWLSAFNANTNFVNTTPTAQFLADALNANKGVEITFQWGSVSGNTFTAGNGGHEVTLQAIDMDAGTITFMDPWGIENAGHAGSSAVSVTDTLQLVGGYLVVGYPVAWVGPDDDTASTTLIGEGSNVGRIIADMIETVPEPVSALLLLVALPFLRRRRTA